MVDLNSKGRRRILWRISAAGVVRQGLGISVDVRGGIRGGFALDLIGS